MEPKKKQVYVLTLGVENLEFIGIMADVIACGGAASMVDIINPTAIPEVRAEMIECVTEMGRNIATHIAPMINKEAKCMQQPTRTPTTTTIH